MGMAVVRPHRRSRCPSSLMSPGLRRHAAGRELGGEYLRDVAARAPQREAVVEIERGLRLDYAAFTRETGALSAALVAAGVGHGNRVAVWTPNRLESVLAKFAIHRGGAVLVGLNPSYIQAELDYVLRQERCQPGDRRPRLP